MEWFLDAKLGIFIHWGIYAVKGIPESWSFFRGEITYEDYMRQCGGFTASKWDPAGWADLFRRAGARYAVLTSKHHDGMALWDTKLGDLSVVKRTPAKRDLIAPYCEAMRKAGLKVGIYFSHLDWSHPDYASVLSKDARKEEPGKRNKYSFPAGKEDPAAWERFIAFHRGQLEELCTNYGKVDLLWFDGDWERDDEQWRMGDLAKRLRAWQPGIVLNSRMRGHGDYATPERAMPIIPPQGPWEFCTTVNDSWGWQVQDNNWKTVRKLVRMFAETIGGGGNLLLDIGPREDGSVPPEAVERLEGLGAWIGRNREAIYGTRAGLPAGYFNGASTLSRDRRTLYLILFDRPWDQVAVKGLRNKVKAVSELGSGKPLKHVFNDGAQWMDIPGILWIDVPEDVLDVNATVI